MHRYDDNQGKWEQHLRKTVVHVGDLDDYRVFFGAAKLGNINDIRRLLNKGFDPSPPLLPPTPSPNLMFLTSHLLTNVMHTHNTP